MAVYACSIAAWTLYISFRKQILLHCPHWRLKLLVSLACGWKASVNEIPEHLCMEHTLVYRDASVDEIPEHLCKAHTLVYSLCWRDTRVPMQGTHPGLQPLLTRYQSTYARHTLWSTGTPLKLTHNSWNDRFMQRDSFHAYHQQGYWS